MISAEIMQNRTILHSDIPFFVRTGSACDFWVEKGRVEDMY